MRNVGGIAQTEAQKSSDLIYEVSGILMKLQVVKVSYLPQEHLYQIQ